VYIFTTSNEHILISSLIFLNCKSVIRWLELRKSYAYDKCRKLRNVFGRAGGAAAAPAEPEQEEEGES
jgi:hypothetical protein